MAEELKIALIGSAPASVRLAPYHDPSWQVWGCSPGAYGVVPKGRSNIWFEMHRYEPGQTWFSPEYCQFLREHPCVVVAEARPEIPNGIVLDYQELVRKYSPYFFTSSLAWMMAYAIEMKATKIGLWGVDMAANEEYEAQRAGLHYFALLAAKAGIEVGTPPESDLFRPRFLYGIDELTHSHNTIRARREELNFRLQAAEQAVQQKQIEASFIRGALDDLNYCFQTWPDKTDWRSPPALIHDLAPPEPPAPVAEVSTGIPAGSFKVN
ncbi:MAG: hypothetical protein VW239_05600 [Candidatus Nanopelagicales bacterium]